MRSFHVDFMSLQGRLPMYLPVISRSALAQSKGSMKEMKAKPLDLFVCLLRMTLARDSDG